MSALRCCCYVRNRFGHLLFFEFWMTMKPAQIRAEKKTRRWLVDISWCCVITDYVWALVDFYMCAPLKTGACIRLVSLDHAVTLKSLFKMAVDFAKLYDGHIDYFVANEGRNWDVTIAFSKYKIAWEAIGQWNKENTYYCGRNSMSREDIPSAALSDAQMKDHRRHFGERGYPYENYDYLSLLELLFSRGFSTTGSKQALYARWFILNKYNSSCHTQENIGFTTEPTPMPMPPLRPPSHNAVFDKLINMLLLESVSGGITYLKNHMATFYARLEALISTNPAENTLKNTNESHLTRVAVSVRDIRKLKKWIFRGGFCNNVAHWQFIEYAFLCGYYQQSTPGCVVLVKHSVMTMCTLGLY
ncbi:hypothetical protein Pelo_17682 [Pelomyxa schiedti]|nr:hypothetical protein Pelo_17682 [Pelomyxa schiedti]